MKRWFPTLCALCAWCALSGCVTTPNTKALVTPIGAAGYHTFKPKQPPPRVAPDDVNRIAAAAAEESRRERDEP